MKTTKEISANWGVSPRYVTTLCSNGRLPGAIKDGKVWLIPDNTQKPEGGLITPSEKNAENCFDYNTFDSIINSDNLYAIDRFITKTISNLYRNNDNNADRLYDVLIDTAADMRKIQFIVSGFHETLGNETVYFVLFSPMAAIDPQIIVEFRTAIDPTVTSTRSLAALSINHILRTEIACLDSGNHNLERVYMYGIGLCGNSLGMYSRHTHPNL